MAAEKFLSGAISDIIPEEWPDVSSLGLEETYHHLRCVHALERFVNPSQLKNHDEDDDALLDPDSADEDGGQQVEDGKDYGKGPNEENTAMQQPDTKPTDEPQLQAIRRMHRQRSALWSRAMDLSRDTLRPLNVFDLPLDIFGHIFDYFKDPYIADPSGMYWNDRCHPDSCKDRRRNVQNARLVCKVFDQLASPLLFSHLTISLDQTSLDFVDKIAKRPLLAKGVHSIEIDLAYRPKDFADDICMFTYRRQKDLDQFRSRSHKLGQECNEGVERDRYDQAIFNSFAISTAWDSYIDQTDWGADEKIFSKYKQILVTGHEGYRKKHEEQFRLVAEGIFVNALAASISMMPQSGTIHFVDSMNRYPSPYDQPTLIPNDTDALARHMQIPHTWRDIELTKGGGAELLAARILTELPIAVHRAGGQLQQMDVFCFPTTGSCSMLRPSHENADSLAWDELHVACQCLEKFCLATNPWNIQHKHIAPENRSYIDKFILGMLSGQGLRDVEVCVDSLGMYDRSTLEWDCYPLGSVLATVNWPCIQKLSVRGVSLNQNELEKFCSGLGRGTLQYIRLSNVQLKKGGWADALDILRDRISATGQTGCEVSTTGLSGGEFGDGNFAKNDIDPRRWLNLGNWECNGRDSIVVQLAELYLAGHVGVTENPLRDSRLQSARTK